MTCGDSGVSFEYSNNLLQRVNIQTLSNRTPFSRHLLFLAAVSMLLYHHFGPHHLSRQLAMRGTPNLQVAFDFARKITYSKGMPLERERKECKRYYVFCPYTFLTRH